MYIPKHKILKGVLRLGMSLFFKNPNGSIGKPYSGPFLELSNGELVSGERVDSNSKPLIALSSEKTEQYQESSSVNIDIEGTPLPFLSDKPQPTLQDIQKGYFERYVIQDKRSKVIKEVNKNTYYRLRDLSTYQGSRISWLLTGSIQDENYNNILRPGLRTKNQQTIDFVKGKYGSSPINDPLEYYQDEITTHTTISGVYYDRNSYSSIFSKKNPSISQDPSKPKTTFEIEYYNEEDLIQKDRKEKTRPTPPSIPEVESEQVILKRKELETQLTKKILSPRKVYRRDPSTGKFIEIK